MKFKLPNNKLNAQNADAAAVSHDFADEKSNNGTQNEAFYFLNIFKPRGITSFDVVYKLRKCLKIKKIGHSGTLDPLAEGVMQVGVGKATRLLDYLGSDKKYVAKIRFGYFSSTADAEGDITQFNIPNFTKDDLLCALKSMEGQIEQIPPAYSAIKVGGKKLCDLARKKEKNKKGGKNGAFEKLPDWAENTKYNESGQVSTCENQDTEPNFTASKNQNAASEGDLDVLIQNMNTEILGFEIPKRQVQIYEAKLLNFVTISAPKNSTSKNSTLKISASENPEEKIPFEAEVEIFCSKGTYIRTFALDLAKKLGTAAYLTSLIRTQAGNFNVKNSKTTDEIIPAEHAIKPHLALDLPFYELNEEEYKKVLNGVSFVPRELELKNSDLMLIFQNNLVSIGVLSDNKIVCKKVFK